MLPEGYLTYLFAHLQPQLTVNARNSQFLLFGKRKKIDSGVPFGGIITDDSLLSEKELRLWTQEAKTHPVGAPFCTS